MFVDIDTVMVMLGSPMFIAIRKASMHLLQNYLSMKPMSYPVCTTNYSHTIIPIPFTKYFFCHFCMLLWDKTKEKNIFSPLSMFSGMKLDFVMQKSRILNEFYV